MSFQQQQKQQYPSGSKRVPSYAQVAATGTRGGSTGITASTSRHNQARINPAAPFAKPAVAGPSHPPGPHGIALKGNSTKSMIARASHPHHLNHKVLDDAVFYFDTTSSRVSNMAKLLQDLGATVASFFSKQVTHVISNRLKTHLDQENAQRRHYQSPYYEHQQQGGKMGGMPVRTPTSHLLRDPTKASPATPLSLQLAASHASNRGDAVMKLGDVFGKHGTIDSASKKTPAPHDASSNLIVADWMTKARQWNTIIWSLQDLKNFIQMNLDHLKYSSGSRFNGPRKTTDMSVKRNADLSSLLRQERLLRQDPLLTNDKAKVTDTKRQLLTRFQHSINAQGYTNTTIQKNKKAPAALGVTSMYSRGARQVTQATTNVTKSSATKLLCATNDPSFHLFNHHYLLINDFYCLHRPIYKEYSPHPDLDIHGYQRYLQRLKQRRKKETHLPIPPCFYMQSAPGQCPFLRPDPSKPLPPPPSTEPPRREDSVAHKIKRRQQMYVRLFLNKKPGYCECCHERYSDLEEHTKTTYHRMFASDASNYVELDQLLLLTQDTAREQQRNAQVASSYAAYKPMPSRSIYYQDSAARIRSKQPVKPLPTGDDLLMGGLPLGTAISASATNGLRQPLLPGTPKSPTLPMASSRHVQHSLGKMNGTLNFEDNLNGDEQEYDDDDTNGEESRDTTCRSDTGLSTTVYDEDDSEEDETDEGFDHDEEDEDEEDDAYDAYDAIDMSLMDLRSRLPTGQRKKSRMHKSLDLDSTAMITSIATCNALGSNVGFSSPLTRKRKRLIPLATRTSMTQAHRTQDLDVTAEEEESIEIHTGKTLDVGGFMSHDGSKGTIPEPGDIATEGHAEQEDVDQEVFIAPAHCLDKSPDPNPALGAKEDANVVAQGGVWEYHVEQEHVEQEFTLLDNVHEGIYDNGNILPVDPNTPQMDDFVDQQHVEDDMVPVEEESPIHDHPRHANDPPCPDNVHVIIEARKGGTQVLDKETAGNGQEMNDVAQGDFRSPSPMDLAGPLHPIAEPIYHEEEGALDENDMSDVDDFVNELCGDGDDQQQGDTNAVHVVDAVYDDGNVQGEEKEDETRFDGLKRFKAEHEHDIIPDSAPSEPSMADHGLSLSYRLFQCKKQPNPGASSPEDHAISRTVIKDGDGILNCSESPLRVEKVEDEKENILPSRRRRSTRKGRAVASKKSPIARVSSTRMTKRKVSSAFAVPPLGESEHEFMPTAYPPSRSRAASERAKKRISTDARTRTIGPSSTKKRRKVILGHEIPDIRKWSGCGSGSGEGQDEEEDDDDEFQADGSASEEEKDPEDDPEDVFEFKEDGHLDSSSRPASVASIRSSRTTRSVSRYFSPSPLRGNVRRLGTPLGTMRRGSTRRKTLI